MIKIHLALVSLFILIQIPAQADNGLGYIVRFRDGVSAIRAQEILQGSGLNSQKHISKLNMHVIQATNPTKSLGFMEVTSLKNSPEVLYIEENQIWRTYNKPNDPDYNLESGLQSMNIETAWNTTTGNSNVIVAVVDTGYSFTHPDLKNQVWTNAGEIPGNNIDDDKDGYIDDVHGWDFGSNDNDPTDQNEHGTHVSGIIGAEGNNGTGISGVNWKVRIMPVSFLTKDGSGNTDDAVKAIIYAADHGARIINASWGGGSFSQALLDAINYAYSKGALFIAAAGNDSSSNDSTPSFPASYKSPAIISVGANSTSGNLAYFSNYGNTVSLVAPGTDIYSTLPNNSYGKLSGTSMATPMVSGVAALTLSANPNLTALQLRNAVLNAVDEKSGYSGKASTRGDINAAKAVQAVGSNSGFQVWPQRITVSAGESFAFTAFNGSGNINWSVDNPSVAKIDSSGVLTANYGGDITVTAADSSGKSASTIRVTLIGGAPPPTATPSPGNTPSPSASPTATPQISPTPTPGGGGCGKSTTSTGATSPQTQNASSSMAALALPLALGLVLRRRKDE